MKAARASAGQLQLEVERLQSEAAEACIGDFVSVLVAGLCVKTLCWLQVPMLKAQIADAEAWT